MQIDAPANDATRPLTDAERDLVRWMLEHGGPAAACFLPQLDRAEATLWKCPCGCASFNFRISGLPPASPGVHVIADFIFGNGEQLKGVFLFENDGVLSGLDVFGYGDGAPTPLPSISDLRPADVQNAV